MTELEIVDLGASGLSKSGVVWATCKGAEVAENVSQDFGKEPPVMCALGLAARPWRADDRGSAQGVVVGQIGGYLGVVVGAQDTRCAKNYGSLGEGETTVFATGDKFDSRAIFGDRIFSVVVGSDMILQIDAKEKRVTINTPGGTIFAGPDGAGILDESGKAMVQVKGGVTSVGGQVVLGGRTPGDQAVSANKLAIELQKIALAFSTFVPGTGAASFANPYVAPGDIKASGVFLGS